MQTLLFIFTLLLALVSAYLWWQVRMQRRTIENVLTEESLDNLEEAPEMILTLRIRDPLVLAKRESRSARILADRLPVMVTKMVYQEVMRELEQELQSRDIDVDMRIEYR